MKKITKILIGIAIAGTVGGSAYLFLRKKGQSTDDLIRSKAWGYSPNANDPGPYKSGMEAFYAGSDKNGNLFVTASYSSRQVVGRLINENLIEWTDSTGFKDYWYAM